MSDIKIEVNLEEKKFLFFIFERMSSLKMEKVEKNPQKKLQRMK